MQQRNGQMNATSSSSNNGPDPYMNQQGRAPMHQSMQMQQQMHHEQYQPSTANYQQPSNGQNYYQPMPQNQPQYGQQDMGDHNGQMGHGQQYEDGDNNGNEKKSRRSKNDNEGRDFKCKHCDKTYLSYPALYTHSKQKHARGPDGEPRAPPSSGRGRGRPRKIPHHRTDPKSDDYFKAPERQGGPTNPLTHFRELFNILLKDKYGKIEDYPLYKELLQFTPSEGAEQEPQLPVENNELREIIQKPRREEYKQRDHLDDDEEDDELDESDSRGSMERQALAPVIKRDPKWKRDYFNLTEQDRGEMLVDEIFALYLFRTSQRVNEDFYKIVLAYVIFFRECLNEIGWNKKIESESIDLDKCPEVLKEMNTQQFCLVNTAEHAPEICNEFVTVYVDQNKHLFEIQRPDQIDLTINLCHWLFESQFTCSKLSMIS